MLDIKLIRENPELIKENIKKKFQNNKLNLVDKVITLDKDWRNLKTELDKLRAYRNNISEQINLAKKENELKKIKELIKEAKDTPKKISKVEEETVKLELEIKQIMLQLPNIISKKTLIGKDESENKEIKKYGKTPKFNFSVKTHVELLEKLNLVDFEASARVSGNGFYYLKDKLALLNQALIRFAIDFMKKKKYIYI